MSKQALLLYPYQLYAVEYLPKDVDEVILVEEPLLFGMDHQYRFYFHKQKIAFHRATMRRYMEEELWPAGFQVDYIEFSHLNETGDIVEKLKNFDHVNMFELNDDVLHRRLQSALQSFPEAPSVTVLPSPNFFLKSEDYDSFFANKANINFAKFYQWQRERFNILINPETYKPIEGKWTFDTDHKKRLPKDHILPTFQVFGGNDFVHEAFDYAEQHFPENPGRLEDFPWPTSRAEARLWLSEFLEHRIDNFGPYEDAIDAQAPWVYHSGLSPLLNVGLLNPDEIIEAALARHEKTPVPIASLEGFIRQILGWREYVMGMYRKRHVAMRTANVFNHQRKMTADWYNGTTGIPPVDDVIKKVLTRSYAHNNERLMILGNVMLLSEFHPDEVYRWFMEMFIDSYDWVSVPNVYGISQYADGGSIVAKPYVSSSNYILSMSHYERGEWADVWDGLYWRFIEKNKDAFKKNPHMSISVRQLERLQENRRRIIGYRADDFLKEKTYLE